MSSIFKVQNLELHVETIPFSQHCSLQGYVFVQLRIRKSGPSTIMVINKDL